MFPELIRGYAFTFWLAWNLHTLRHDTGRIMQNFSCGQLTIGLK